ncbi:MAG: hypothetical protein IEMM0008_0247 [bacterium]|nr:MAG: hypothetical protein IEMM0008_0247 [bacterium]
MGIGLNSYMMILEKVTAYIVAEREISPMKKRGRKFGLPLADRLLLTFRYLRHYPTFARLGKEFGISESYANKIYHRILDILLKVLNRKSRKDLMNSDLEMVLIDVTEQPIERPKRRQKAYYSGKKNAIP